MEILISLVMFTLLFSTTKAGVTGSNYSVLEEVRVGLVVDLGSVEGKLLKTSFTLALSDFYHINSGYRTRVSVLVRDSRGDPLLALAAVRNLVKKSRVEIIVGGAQSLHEAKLFVPNSLSLNKHNHFIQWTHDTVSEAKGIASLVHDIACVLANVVEKRSLRDKATRSSAAEASWNVSDLVRLIKHSRRFNGGTQINCGRFIKRRRIIWPGGSDKTPPRHRFLAEDGENKKLLRVLVPAGNRVPNLVRVSPDPETGVVIVTGLCMEIFKTCMDPLKYEMEFIPYNGSYDNLAYLLSTQRDKYDAAAGDLTITSNRSLYVDFTLPFTDIGIGALTLKKKKHGMWTFFDPFEKPLWLASGAFFILTGMLVWLVERPVNPEFQGSWKQQLGTMLWFGFSTIVFAHREKLQKMSSRFLVVVWMFVVLILTASYSANLTSTKTISRIQLDNQLSFGPSNMKISNSINAIEAYAQLLRDGTVNHVVDEIPYLNILLGQYPDVFAMTDREAVTNGFGFMFQKGSGLAPRVSREIAKLRTSGTLKDMEKRWFQKLDSFYVNSNDNDDDDNASNRFTFGELGGLFIIAGAAHALVLVMHLFQTRREILRVLCESRLFTKLKSFARFWRC
ncbi:glutamate receptor 1.1-like [Raphanus sativus]|uniref:Glutamate receptor 1.1-like n=1 Tax=Raphanus sativus TaxID=3726 RepID=A0A6J0KB43_RAPSA|nr:glutamate receptor 1.1-like [Raphanus sativus]